jgi:hypothetical protein
VCRAQPGKNLDAVIFAKVGENDGRAGNLAFETRWGLFLKSKNVGALYLYPNGELVASKWQSVAFAANPPLNS